MTCVIGFQLASGDQLLVADTRATWEIKPGIFASTRDDLQKLYFEIPGVVLAFTGSELEALARKLDVIRKDAGALRWDGSTAQSAHAYCDGIRRIVERELASMRKYVGVIAGVAFPDYPSRNKLLHIFKQPLGQATTVEIPPLRPVVDGSACREKRFDRFWRDVIEATFVFVQREHIDEYIDELRTNWTVFMGELPRPWDRIGEVFCGLWSEEGNWFGETQEFGIFRRDRPSIRIVVTYQRARRRFALEDLIHPRTLELIPINEYRFDLRTSAVFRLLRFFRPWAR